MITDEQKQTNPMSQTVIEMHHVKDFYRISKDSMSHEDSDCPNFPQGYRIGATAEYLRSDSGRRKRA